MNLLHKMVLKDFRALPAPEPLHVYWVLFCENLSEQRRNAIPPQLLAAVRARGEKYPPSFSTPFLGSQDAESPFFLPSPRLAI